jgi:hypothetical protein
MTLRRFLISAAGVLIAAVVAYMVGYWPERTRRLALEANVATMRGQLNDAEARVRMARLLGDLLIATEAATALNYGQAQGLASKFFDEAQTEAARTHVPSFKMALETILQSRDTVTAALTRADPTVVDTLRNVQLQLREALAYPVSRAA